MKKLLLLGGLRYLLPVIETAHKLGLYVITCDNIPDNIAHNYSDEYRNISIIDKGAVLKLAKQLEIDGIMSFAVDPGVLTAAYVAEELGLPGPPYKSVKILQNKALFRQFLAENNFNVPKAKGFSTYEDAENEIDFFKFPVIVKPVDSAGSKGVTKVDDLNGLYDAINIALSNSVYANEFIIEEFITNVGFPSDSDCFSVDSDLRYISFSNQFFDINANNPYTPAGFSWPSEMPLKHQKFLVKELKRLVKILKLGTSIYNIEVRVGRDQKPYIMEVSPRGGGNRLSEILKYVTGTDLIRNAINASLGETIENLSLPTYNGYWVEIILHSERNGVFKNLYIKPEIQKNLFEIDLWIEEGDKVNAFNAANNTLGTIIAKFNTKDEMFSFLRNQRDFIRVISSIE